MHWPILWQIKDCMIEGVILNEALAIGICSILFSGRVDESCFVCAIPCAK